MKRFVLWAGGILLVGIGVAFIWLAFSLDGIVARAIARHGSAALGTTVEVGSVEIDLREGRGTIRELRIQNPEGFSPGAALRFGELTLAIVPESLMRTPIRLTQVRLLDPVVRVELDARGRSNIQALQQNVAAYSPPAEEEAPKTASGEPLRLRIDALSMERGLLETDLRAVGNEQRETNLPAFSLKNLGGNAGAEPAVLAKEVALQLTRQLTRSIARAQIGSAIEREIDERLGDRPEGEVVKELLRSLGNDAD